MAVVMKTYLRQLREELHPRVSQEAMARKVGLSLQWYRQIESGKNNTSFTTANAILSVMNNERVVRKLDQLDLKQLDLSIV